MKLRTLGRGKDHKLVLKHFQIKLYYKLKTQLLPGFIRDQLNQMFN